MDRFLTAEARPRNLVPNVIKEDDKIGPFIAVQTTNEQPFACTANPVYMLTGDSVCKTEIINSMIERKYIDQEEITRTPRQMGEALLTERKGKKLIGLVVKNHIDQRLMRPDIKECIEVLKAMAIKEVLKVIGVVRGPAMIKNEEWGYLVDMVNKIFKDVTVAVYLSGNSLNIPAVGIRYKLIGEYHKSAAGGHIRYNEKMCETI